MKEIKIEDATYKIVYRGQEYFNFSIDFCKGGVGVTINRDKYRHDTNIIYTDIRKVKIIKI